MKYRIQGPAGTTRWYDTADQAWGVYERRSRRTGIACRMHIPGRVAGDGYEAHRIQGPGPGGYYYLESA